MACFLVPAAEAAAVAFLTKAMETKEKKAAAENNVSGTGSKITFSGKLKWLNNMLLGGSALLAFEHLWHGEIVPWPPFLTAAGDPAEISAMLHEMATTGVSMALLVTAVWGIMVLAANAIEKKERGHRLQALSEKNI